MRGGENTAKNQITIIFYSTQKVPRSSNLFRILQDFSSSFLCGGMAGINGDDWHDTVLCPIPIQGSYRRVSEAIRLKREREKRDTELFSVGGK
jgi:hypothetical protein